MQEIHTFYQFADFPDFEKWKDKLQSAGEQYSILGTLILAPEGINATISGTNKSIEQFLAFIREDKRFSSISTRSTQSERPTFYRLRIITRPEIVTLGDTSILPSNGVGEYVEPEDWNALLDDPEVELVDVRNAYEVALGTFDKAINPETQTFGQWAEFVQKKWGQQPGKKVAMFCTGGIRCEKASAHLVQNGFPKVYHLKGGILNYLEKVDPAESKWDGECFVFDHRVSVKHGLTDGSAKLCFSCRWPLDEQDLSSEHYEEGVSCPRCISKITPERMARLRERQKQVQLARKRKVSHIGLKMPDRQKDS